MMDSLEMMKYDTYLKGNVQKNNKTDLETI
jgi:hypothetical protein